MNLSLLILLPFLGSILAGLLPPNARNREAVLSGLIAFACMGIVLWSAPTIFAGGIIEQQIEWLPFLDLNIIFRLDGFAWLFALIVSLMGLLVVIYARYYMDPADPVPRFFAFFLAFMGSMLGVVISGNVIQLVIFWELTSLSSFMLIAYWHHRPEARMGARIALTITAGGGFCLLAAMLLIGQVVGSYELDVILNSGDLIRRDGNYTLIVILFALGALTKSAQFPFHFWLPNAMAAPTPVSAYLHSATLVKAGVFLLARFWPILAMTEQWFWIIGLAGLLSLTIGAYIATFQRDMKGVLAYSTISHLGLITLLLGLNSQLALIAAIFHMINHATFKASLFMATGIVDHETGTRDMTVLSGLRRSMPLTATLATVAAAAMAGVPLLNGFISKEMFFSEILFVNDARSYLLPILAVIATTFSVAYSLRFILQVFFGPEATQLPRQPHEPPKWMLFPSAFLVCLCILIGVLPDIIISPILTLAASSILGDSTPSIDLAIFHGFNIPLLMSTIALIGGIVVYIILCPYLRSNPGQTLGITHLNGSRIFDSIMNGLDNIALNVNAYIASNRVQVQVLCIVLVSFIVALIPLLRYQDGLVLPRSSFDIAFALLWAMGALCAIGAARQAKYNRFRTVIFAGGAGIVTTVTFVWLSAPDLALTQLVIEVVTVVLLLLGLRWLPRHNANNQDILVDETVKRLRRGRDAIIAIVTGLGITVLTYIIITRDTIPAIGQFFSENALPKGGGTNIVNVILVDFRAFDTYGEITVLGIVALTVYALLRRFRPPEETIYALEKRNLTETPDLAKIKENEALPRGTLLVPNVLVRLMVPLVSLIAVFFFLRGHNLPGGGFVAGVIFAIGIIVQYIISGIHWVELNSRVRPLDWLATGLLFAVIAGIWPLFYGLPFLSALAWDIHLPLVGSVHLSSVILFDLGVFALVVGSSTYMLVALAHQSLRSQRQSQGAK
ncbi:monovalent cation/H+ antiporter subunit A [Pelistega sp. NLN82]|uniref:Monovalent cation/H+ antiporter subunit A n=1 Tax=Pelistega ratti TaxID=2652177 RepID=A0A6L9Y3W1_9BURK|nr:monovalent cation/H+ antiporter subunit A [Pelistega ratti]NEN75122.1 monovalent cation/H+ antiporter subunit A [Pelistega ratti]